MRFNFILQMAWQGELYIYLPSVIIYAMAEEINHDL